MATRIFIKTNFDLCTGCSLCQLACSERFLGGYNPHRALLRIRHENENLYHFPVVCNQCANPYCANVCPVQAIQRDAETGAMVVDREICVGCNLCHRYCPIHVVGVDPEIQKSVKCDLCGGDPRCVAACPTGALELACLAASDSRMEVNHG
jgi:Fe-S-cluster-containing hydrogenase component 2